MAAWLGAIVKISGATELTVTSAVALPAPEVTANGSCAGWNIEWHLRIDLKWQRSQNARRTLHSPSPRSLPGPRRKIETMPPGAISAVKLAALTMPPAKKRGFERRNRPCARGARDLLCGRGAGEGDMSVGQRKIV